MKLKKKEDSHPTTSRPRLLLLLLEKSKERDTRNLHDLEPDSRNITNSMTFTSKSSDQDFILQTIINNHITGGYTL
jgi:uncharacterized protein (DUF1810 family)